MRDQDELGLHLWKYVSGEESGVVGFDKDDITVAKVPSTINIINFNFRLGQNVGK